MQILCAARRSSASGRSSPGGGVAWRGGGGHRWHLGWQQTFSRAALNERMMNESRSVDGNGDWS